jgi:putative membrane protein
MSAPGRAIGQWLADYGMLAALSVVTVAALAGYSTFRLRPELLAQMPEAIPFYSIAFSLFARVQIIAAFATLAFFLWRAARTRWIPAFLALYAISLASELMGTTVGLPFGPYRYTEALGISWFGHVPILIPVSWFFMAVPSYALAGTSATSPYPRRTRIAAEARRIAIASLLLLTWDLSLDPAMSSATAYWVWGSEGAYYGMPLLNLFGWYVTGIALMAALAALGADRWLRFLPRRWMAAFYAVNLLLPVGMSVASGMWGAAAVTFAVLGVCTLLIGRRSTDSGRVTLQVVP